VAPAAPSAPAPAEPVAPTAPAAETPSAPAPVEQNTPAAETPSADQPATEGNQEEAAAPTEINTPTPVQTAEKSRVSVLSMMAAKNAPIAALASLVMVSFATVGYALTHRSAFQHAVTAGEHFVVAHPGLDSAIVAAITSLILLTTYGNLA
jgi:hypothetical protein